MIEIGSVALSTALTIKRMSSSPLRRTAASGVSMMSFVLALPMPKIWALAFARVRSRTVSFSSLDCFAVGQDGDDLSDEIGFGDLGRLRESAADEEPEKGRAEKFFHIKKAFSLANIKIACSYDNFFDNFSD